MSMNVLKTLSTYLMGKITYLSYPTDTKILEPIHKGHHNLIRVFNAYVNLRTHDNDPIGHKYMNFTNDNFNEFHITGYDYFRR